MLPLQWMAAACVLVLAAPASGQDELDELFDDELDALLGGESIGEAGAEADSVVRGSKGFVELKPRVFLEDRNGEKNDEQLLFEAELELDLRFREDFSGYFRPRILLDALESRS